MEKITSFRDQYRFLSNFHQNPVTLDGLTYPNGEAAFQALKAQGIRPAKLEEAPGLFNKLFGGYLKGIDPDIYRSCFQRSL